MLRVALVSLKQHRFEVRAAVLACLALGVWGLFLELRLAAFAVPSSCFEIWKAAGPDAAGDCAGPIYRWAEPLANEGTRIVGAMAYLPFAVGLLGGVPIVARELESHTAQTAWSLNPSRLRWLGSQVLPIAIVLGVAVAFASFVASGIQADRETFGESAFFNLALHGPVVVARAFAAFGLGLLVGAVIGRSLPAFVTGVFISLVLVVAASSARDAWLATLEPEPVSDSAAASDGSPNDGLVITAVAWRAQDGTVLTTAEARELADAAGVPPGDPTNPQDIPMVVWLEENGFVEIPVGVTEERALGWRLYDGLLFAFIGLIALAAATVVVSRRRPA